MKVTGEIFSYLEKEPKRQKNGVVSGIEVKGADYFNWDSIERISITNYYEDSGSMKIWCEKMILFRINYE